MLPTVKIAGRLVRNADFDVPTCLVSSLWFSRGVAVSMGEAAKPLLFEGFQAGCHVVLRVENVKIGGSRARNARFSCTHVSRLESLGFPVASPCLWGKLQNLSFSKVSKQVVCHVVLRGRRGTL